MAPSTRTPDGVPNRCPVCGAEARVDPSRPFGDAPCPACGTLLWFTTAGSSTMVIEAARVDRAADRLGVDPDALRAGRWPELGLDSLDVVELIMELEEEQHLG